MSEWISLNPEQVSRQMRQTRREDGIEISVALSPYEIPDAVRGVFDSTLKQFVVEFRYLAQEAWLPRRHDDYITLRVGKNSGRIYGIEIDVIAMKAKAVGLTMHLPKMVNRAIDKELRTVEGRARRETNYQLAKSAISDERDMLFGDLVGAG
jgi:hypothetical protein